MKWPALHYLFFAATTALFVYWPGLYGQFFFDDYPNIVLDESLFLKSLAPEELWSVINGGAAGPLGRGVARLSFALNYYWAGLDPFAFKWTNLLVHLLNGYLVYMLAGICLRTVRTGVGILEEKQEHYVALFISAIWLLHPIQLLPVLHVVQRMTSLAAFFVFLAMLLHIKGRMSSGYNAMLFLMLAWLIFLPLGVLSKESALLFPAFVIIWEFFLNRRRVGGLDTFARIFISLCACLGVGLSWYLLSPQGAWLWAGYQFREFSPLERGLTEARVIWNYIDLMLLPRYEEFGLYHDDVVVSSGVLNPPITALALLSGSVVILGSWLARKSYPLVAFGVFWFVAGHFLESSVLPLELMHEHRNYLPSFGLFLALGAGFIQATSFRELRGIVLILAGAFLVYCIFLTSLRSHQFGDELRRSQIEAQHHRRSPSAHIDAGRVLANSTAGTDASAPAYFLSLRHFEIASELDPKIKMGFMGMIGVSCRAQVVPKAEWIDSLALRLHETPFAPGDQNVLYSLKELAINLPNCLSRAQVSALFDAAATNKSAPRSVVAVIRSWEADYYWLGLRSLPSARNSLDRALAINPASRGMRLKKVQLDYLDGNFEVARSEMDLLKKERLTIDEKRLFNELVPLIYGTGSMSK